MKIPFMKSDVEYIQYNDILNKKVELFSKYKAFNLTNFSNNQWYLPVATLIPHSQSISLFILVLWKTIVLSLPTCLFWLSCSSIFLTQTQSFLQMWPQLCFLFVFVHCIHSWMCFGLFCYSMYSLIFNRCSLGTNVDHWCINPVFQPASRRRSTVCWM